MKSQVIIYESRKISFYNRLQNETLETNNINETLNPKIDLKYILLIFISVFASTILHEIAHWSMGEILSNTMIATLNGTYPASGNYLHDWHRNYVTMAGSVFTILQAILFYFLIFKYKRIELYPFLFFPLVFRIAAD